ncbi:MAG: type II toxin-antitoxin system RelE/ParE family toxin [Hyphomicrobiales bacterium]|nr:type II toxin-antitoxin system RelE/ParE family toxin [Hyphomicrobiales bacterium]
MIRTFKDRVTQAIAEGQSPEGFPKDLLKVARRKLFMLDNAAEFDDLRSPPGNKLHPLKEDRNGQHAIRINDKYRLCFRWVGGNAEDVEIVDYH